MAFVIHHAAVTGIGKPNAAVRVNDDIIGCVQRLALPFLRKNCNGSIVFMTHDATSGMLAREQATFPVKGVAVCVIRRTTKRAYMAILGKPPMLDIVWNITPEQITAAAVPCWTLGPQHSCVQALDGCVSNLVFRKPFIQHQHVSVGISHW